jgi:hypothetical protein
MKIKANHVLLIAAIAGILNFLWDVGIIIDERIRKDQNTEIVKEVKRDVEAGKENIKTVSGRTHRIKNSLFGGEKGNNSYEKKVSASKGYFIIVDSIKVTSVYHIGCNKKYSKISIKSSSPEEFIIGASLLTSARPKTTCSISYVVEYKEKPK